MTAQHVSKFLLQESGTIFRSSLYVKSFSVQVTSELDLHLEAHPVALCWASAALLLIADASGALTVLEQKQGTWISYRLPHNLPACLPHSLTFVKQGGCLLAPPKIIEITSLSLK